MRAKVPSQLDYPSLLMNFPFTVDNRERNNDLMWEDDGPYDYNLAYGQFIKAYNILNKESLIYLLPSEGNYQDQPYVANVGCYLPHLDKPTIVLSKFKSPPRMGEEDVAVKMFDSMGYRTYFCPYYWEGEADLKYIGGNRYVGGYGIRTDIEAHRWFEDMFDMKVVSVKMEVAANYHWDCSFFPLSKQKVLMATTACRSEDVKEVEKVAEVISVPEEFDVWAWTNVVRIGNKIFKANSTEESDNAFCSFIEKLGYEPIILDLSEFEKSGAALSCMCMHFNYLHLR